MIEITLTKEQHAAALLAYAETLGIKIAQTPNVAYEWRADEHGNIHCTFRPTTGIYPPDVSTDMIELEKLAAQEVWDIFDRWVPNAHCYDGLKKAMTSRGTVYITFMSGIPKAESDDGVKLMHEFDTAMSEQERARTHWPAAREGLRKFIYENVTAKQNVMVWRIRPKWIVDAEGNGAWRCRLAFESDKKPEIPSIEPGETKDWRDADGGFGQGFWGL